MTAIENRGRAYLCTVSDPCEAERAAYHRGLAARVPEPFATAPRDGRPFLAWNRRTARWEVLRFDPIARQWEASYRGRGAELLGSWAEDWFAAWAELPAQPARFICHGCGRSAVDPAEDLAAIRATRALSCCPERDMRPVWE